MISRDLRTDRWRCAPPGDPGYVCPPPYRGAEGGAIRLSDSFTANPNKYQQWKAFLLKSKLMAPGLTEVGEVLRRLLEFPESEAS